MSKCKNAKATALEITKREGLKKQLNVAQASEVVGVFSDIVFEMGQGSELLGFMQMLYNNGAKRAKKYHKS